MDSDTSNPTTTSSKSVPSYKPSHPSMLKTLFKCWKKNKNKGNKHDKPQPGEKPDKKAKFQDEESATNDPDKNKNNKQTDPMTDGGEGDSTDANKTDETKPNGKNGNKGGDGNGKQQSRCPKCYKKKREKDPTGQRLDGRYCKCRSGGYCNTNTIVFPSNFNKGSVESRELHYLQLIRDIIRDESRKNVSDISEFRREMDRQRDEIKELKQLILQSLLTNAKSDNSRRDLRGDESTLPPSSRQSPIGPGGKPLESKDRKIESKEDIPRKSTQMPTKSQNEKGKEAEKSDNADQGPAKAPEKGGVWNKFFGKKS